GDRVRIALPVEAGQDDGVGRLEEAPLLLGGEGDRLAPLHGRACIVRTDAGRQPRRGPSFRFPSLPPAAMRGGWRGRSTRGGSSTCASSGGRSRTARRS